MAEIWRLLDTGLAAPAHAIALTRALLEARHADEIPDTLRFSRITRCVLLGCNQSAAQELDIEYCGAHAIPIQRRITGGSAAYVDQRQLVWELYMRRSDAGGDLDLIAKRLCHAAATAISACGTDARFRPRRDLEIDGRTLGTAGFAVDGDALVLQGLVLLDCEAGDVLSPLRTPWRAASGVHASEARKRVVSLKHALGHLPDIATLKHKLIEAFESELDVEFRENDLGLTEQARSRTAVREIDSAEWVDHIDRPASEAPLVEATHATAAGTLHAFAVIDTRAKSIRQVWFEGDIPVAPARTLRDLEAALRGTAVERLGSRVESFFMSRPAELGGFLPADFSAVVLKAATQRLVAGKS